MANASFNVRELLELERQLYQESIDRTQQQHAELLRGSLEAFVVRCIPFEDEKGWEIEAAMVQLQLNKRNGLDLLEFELKQAEDVHQAQREELKQQLLANAHRRLRRVQSRLQSLRARDAATNSSGVDSSSPMQCKRRQRKKATPSPTRDPLFVNEDLGRQTLLGEVHDVQRCAQKAFNLRHLVDGLPSAARVVDDVFAEVEKLQQHLSVKAGAQDASQGVRIDVNTEDEMLAVCEKPDAQEADATFRVNDFVVLSSRLSEEDFYGQITAITEHDVQLVLVCGTKARVTIHALQTQQCALRHQLQKTCESLLLLGYDERTILDTKQIRLDAQLRKKGKRKRTLDIRRGF